MRAVERLLGGLKGLQHCRKLLRLVDLPIFLRREANARPVRPAALVGAAEGRRRRPGRRDQLGDRQARCEDFGLERGDVLSVDQCMIDRRNRILPELRLGNLRAQQPDNRTHVPMGQLVPSLGEGLGKLVGVFVEAL